MCLWTGLAAWTVGGLGAARTELAAALALADRAGWPPWSAAARQALAVLDDPAAPLPFGLPRHRSFHGGRPRAGVDIDDDAALLDVMDDR